MSWPDIINGSFLFGGGLFIWLNVRRLYIDKTVAGVSVWPSIWFATWGVWDCYFFPHLSQWVSFLSSALAVAPNATWLYLYWYYRRRIP